MRPFSASSGKDGVVLISSGGGGRPAWSPNGRELLYRASGHIMSVAYTARGGVFVAGKPSVWAANVSGSAGFDIAPDGKQLAVIVPVAAREGWGQDSTIVFVQNFLDELRRRAPVAQ